MAKRIAIVEDDDSIRANYSDALTRHGYQVSAYSNRKDAEAAFETRLPDLAIVDIGLGADGARPAARRFPPQGPPPPRPAPRASPPFPAPRPPPPRPGPRTTPSSEGS